jgi:hypothetical protein
MHTQSGDVEATVIIKQNLEETQKIDVRMNLWNEQQKAVRILGHATHS